MLHVITVFDFCNWYERSNLVNWKLRSLPLPPPPPPPPLSLSRHFRLVWARSVLALSKVFWLCAVRPCVVKRKRAGRQKGNGRLEREKGNKHGPRNLFPLSAVSHNVCKVKTENCRGRILGWKSSAKVFDSERQKTKSQWFFGKQVGETTAEQCQ